MTPACDILFNLSPFFRNAKRKSRHGDVHLVKAAIGTTSGSGETTHMDLEEDKLQQEDFTDGFPEGANSLAWKKHNWEH